MGPRHGDEPDKRTALYAENFEHFGDHMIIVPNETMTLRDQSRVFEHEIHGRSAMPIVVPIVEICGPKFRALLHCHRESERV